jgi:hypothetical protein
LVLDDFETHLVEAFLTISPRASFVPIFDPEHPALGVDNAV